MYPERSPLRRFLAGGALVLLLAVLPGPGVSASPGTGAPPPPPLPPPASPAAVRSGGAASPAPPTAAPALPPEGAARVTGSVEVHVFLATPDQPVAGREVTLEAQHPGRQAAPAPRRWQATTDAAGVARFPAVELAPGETLVARAEQDGIAYDTPGSALLPETRLTLPLFPRSRDASLLRLARVATEIALWEKSLHVQQELTLANPSDHAVDLRPSGPGEPVGRGLVFPLPEGAIGVRAGGAEFRSAGGEASFTGLVRPGPAEAVTLRLSYQLPVARSTFELRQPLPMPAEELLTVVPREPIVLGRPVPGVTLRVVQHEHHEMDERAADGGTFWVLRGGAGPAGAGGARSPGHELRLTLAGLPVRSLAPAWAALLLSVLLVVAGGLLPLRGSRSRNARPGLATGATPAAERARLFRRLEALERDWQARGRTMPAPAERERLIRRLAELELAGAGAPPGEGGVEA